MRVSLVHGLGIVDKVKTKLLSLDESVFIPTLNL
jgi:hypothetical protein